MKETLYTLTSKVDDFERKCCQEYYDNVGIHWYVRSRRTQASRDYDLILQQYLDKLDSDLLLPAVNLLRSYFTADEGEQFDQYLKDSLGWNIKKLVRRKFNIDQESSVLWIERTCKIFSNSYFGIFTRKDYKLPFDVAGYLNWNNAILQKAQDLALEIKISRDVMKPLLPMMGNRYGPVSDLVHKAAENAIKNVIGELPGKISVSGGYGPYDYYDDDDDLDDDYLAEVIDDEPVERVPQDKASL